MGEQIEDEIDSDAYVSVELKMNSEIINVKRKRLILLKDKDLLTTKSSSNKAKSRSRSRSSEASKRKDKKSKKEKKRLKWVLPNIIIRVVSKKVEDGKLYNRKLRVIDVLNDYQFSATPIDSSSTHLIVYSDLREKEIETVIPKDQSEEILILKGDFRGDTGKILSRDRKRDEVIV